MDANPYTAPRNDFVPAVVERPLLAAPLAELTYRLFGAVIDGLFNVAISLAIALPLRAFVAALLKTEVSNEMKFWSFETGALIALIVQCVLLTHRQQSAGKIALKMKIVRMDGSCPSFSQIVVLRTVAFTGMVWLLSLAQHIGFHEVARVPALLSLADHLTIFFRDNRRCLHDYLAGTKVVMLPR
jgi:uncharacterized RDD family membrane protein YckC